VIATGARAYAVTDGDRCDWMTKGKKSAPMSSEITASALGRTLSTSELDARRTFGLLRALST
jgi:hypothetical protein